MNKIQEIGELLKKTRLERSLELSNISDVLRIRRKYLESIENGSIDDIPGHAYINGYIKMYAEYLGILPQINKLQVTEKTQRIKFASARKNLGNSWLLAGVFFILILTLIFLVLSRYDTGKQSKSNIETLLEQEDNYAK